MRLVALILLLCPSAAFADPGTLMLIGSVITNAGGWYAVAGYTLMIGSAVYGADQQRKKAAAERENQRKAYNASLEDRTITRVATDAPYRYVYGRARVGSDIVAIFSAGDRDEYKWLVCIHAAHECDAIEEVYVNGKALGTLDANGDVTQGDYLYIKTGSVGLELHSGTSFTLAHTPVPGSFRIIYHLGETTNPIAYTLAGNVVTVPASADYLCHYDYLDTVPRVRVKKHLGTAVDGAEPELMALTPAWFQERYHFKGWQDTSVLRGFCYTAIRLDLNQAEFQGGIPPIEVLLRGKKLYDVRTGLTAWSQNPALAIRDYLTSEVCGVEVVDIPDADYIAAANVCDEALAFGARYTINGVVTADQDSRKVLDQMAACMAGGLVGTTWGVWAGKYTAPVMALDQSDIVGSLSVIGGTSDADLYNGVRGRYIGSENLFVPTDVKPYQNAVYLSADGRELWNDMEFPFTDSASRIHNLARIALEDQRNGFTIKAGFSLKAYRLKVGNRVSFTSSFLGQTDKIYRVTDKRYGPGQPVELTLKEDAASIYDEADAVVVDATPNTNLPNPFSVGLCGDVQMVETIYETTGSAGVRSRARLSWTAPADVSVVDYELEYKPYTSGVWIDLVNVRGTFYDFVDLAPGTYDFRVKARNSLGVVGEYTAIKSFTLYGLTVAPANVANFSVAAMAGMALASWDKTTDLDVKIGGKVVIRFCPLTVGASWEQSTVMEEFNGDAVNGIVPLATGTYYAKFVDSTGHYSDTEANFVATEALVTGWTTVATSAQHPTFGGVKTNVAVLDGRLQLDSLETIGAQVNLMSTWGMIGSLGGIQSSGEYAFDATLDLGSKAARRFHAGLKALSFETGDTISLRGDVSTWPSVSGAVINDCDATLLASVSDDDITYGPWTPFMVADFDCRYAKLKLQLASGLSTHNIQVSELTVAVKLPA